MPGIRRTVAGLLLTALAFGPAACLDDASSAPRPEGDAAALVLNATASVASAADHEVGIRVYYLRGSAQVDLPATPSRVALAAGETRRQAVTVQLGRCLADEEREGAPEPGCLLYVELRLIDGGTVVDAQTSRPASPSLPGRVVELPSISLSEVASVTVASTGALLVQDSRTLAVTATGPAGQALTGRIYTWSSSAPGVATVTDAGVVTGVAPGTAVITAATGGKTGQTTLRVLARVATVDVAPSPATVAQGGTRALTVTARDAAGNTLTDLAERTVTWTSDAPGVATVSAAGVVTGVKLGTATVTVSVDGVTRSVPITVGAARVSVAPATPALIVGDTARLAATALDAAGAAIPGVSFAWSSSAPAVATVDGNGLVTARGAGTATITATGASASGTATVTVTALPLTLTPTNARVLIARALALQLQNAIGDVTWTSSDPTIASVDTAGVVTARFPGTATITATNGSRTATATIVAAPASVSWTADAAESMSIDVGNTLRNLTAYDADGMPIAGISVSWTVSDPSLATIDPATGDGRTAVLTGLEVGSVTVTAREAHTGYTLRSATFNIFPPVAWIGFNPFVQSMQMVVGQTATVTVEVGSRDESPQVGRLLRASSSNAAITVTPSARTNGAGLASFTITAVSFPPNTAEPLQVNLSFRADGDPYGPLVLPIFLYRTAATVAPRRAPEAP